MTIDELVGCDYKELTIYDFSGKLTDNPNHAAALSFTDDTNSKIFRVLFDKMKAHLVTPNDIYDNHPAEWVYKRINERGFRLYLNYLQGGGMMNLTAARGELSNAAY